MIEFKETEENVKPNQSEQPYHSTLQGRLSTKDFLKSRHKELARRIAAIEMPIEVIPWDKLDPRQEDLLWQAFVGMSR